MQNSPQQILVSLTTVANREQAHDLAQSLITNKVAACVQVDGPIESHYHWEGQSQIDHEYRIVIKTSVGQKTRLRQLVEELHPYDQPQIITLESADVAPGYARWVEQQTGP